MFIFLTKYKLVILNCLMLFGIICITFLPENYWMHGNGFWQGVITVGLMINIRETIKQIKE